MTTLTLQTESEKLSAAGFDVSFSCSDKLREEYVTLKHKSGLTVILFPKKLKTAYAIVATKFGSVDASYRTGEGEIKTLPIGTAHFLEHKLFANEDGTDAIEKLASLGADGNAYTSYTRTAYLFNCSENFERSLKELLVFVTHPYFAEEAVEKEKKIIGEEIRMVSDSPDDRCFENLLAAMYRHSPIRHPICGTQKTISAIHPDVLYDCYSTFYDLSNMVLVVCGDVTLGSIMRVCDDILPKASTIHPDILREEKEEPMAVNKALVTDSVQVSKPIFIIGVKDTVGGMNPAERIRRDVGMTLLNEVLFSRSGEFYSSLFESNRLSPVYSYGYSITSRFAFNLVSGESDEPQAIFEEWKTYIEKVKKNGFSKPDFERARKILYADFVKSFDSTEEIANTMLDFTFDEFPPFEYPDVIQSVTYEEAFDLLNTVFRPEFYTLSIANPLDSEKKG